MDLVSEEFLLWPLQDKWTYSLKIGPVSRFEAIRIM